VDRVNSSAQHPRDESKKARDAKTDTDAGKRADM
jgi:hypothetical protein